MYSLWVFRLLFFFFSHALKRENFFFSARFLKSVYYSRNSEVAWCQRSMASATITTHHYSTSRSMGPPIRASCPTPSTSPRNWNRIRRPSDPRLALRRPRPNWWPLRLPLRISRISSRARRRARSERVGTARLCFCWPPSGMFHSQIGQR